MSDPSGGGTPRAQEPEPGACPRASSSRRTRISTALGAALSVNVLVVVTAVSLVSLAGVLGCTPRHGHHGDPSRIREFAEWRVEKVLKKIDATPGQKELVLTVVDGLIGDLTAMHEDRGDMHEALLAQLTAETIDQI